VSSDRCQESPGLFRRERIDRLALDSRLVHQLCYVPRQHFPSHGQAECSPKDLVNVRNGLGRETGRESIVDHSLDVLWRELIKLDLADCRDQVLLDVDPISGIGKGSDA